MAVYTDVSFEELEAFLTAYDLGEPHVFKGIAEGVSNSNYYLQTTKGAYILTLYEMRVETADLPFYLGLIAVLGLAGLGAWNLLPGDEPSDSQHPLPVDRTELVAAAR